MPTLGIPHGTRAKVMVGIAAALVAAYFIKVVAEVDLSSRSWASAFAAKGTGGALGLIFCLFLYSDSGRLLRKIVGTISLLVALLLVLSALSGVLAWLVASMPFTGILGGNRPATIAAAFAANAYIAWTFCFSASVRAYEGRLRQINASHYSS